MWIYIHTPGIHINTKLGMWTYIYTYTRHTHKYKVNTYRLYNGVKEKDNTRVVRTRIYKQSYKQTLTTITRKETENQAQQQ